MLSKKEHQEQINRLHKGIQDLSNKIDSEVDEKERGNLALKYYMLNEIWMDFDVSLESLKNRLDVLDLRMPTNEIPYSENNTLPDKETIAVSASHFDSSVQLLRKLADLQNGAPLIRHEKEWNETMNEVWEFLEANEV